MDTVIRTEHLTHVYSRGTPFEKVAISDVNVEIHAGELVAVIGHTGSGKSTFMQHLNGLLRPSSGAVYVDGEDLMEVSSYYEVLFAADPTSIGGAIPDDAFYYVP